MSITREELEEYQLLNAERKSLERKAKALEEREKMIIAKAHAELTASGRNQIQRFGFGLILEAGRANVPWKEAFIKECGPAAANKLSEAAADEAKKQENLKAKILPPIAS